MANDDNRPFAVGGVHHLALVCSDMARTVEFYTEVLGFPLVKTVELPAGMGQHFFFDIGGGDSLAFFWFAERPAGRARRRVAPRRAPTTATSTSAVGSMNHVAFAVPRSRSTSTATDCSRAASTCSVVVNHDDSEWTVSEEMHPACSCGSDLLPGSRRDPARVRGLDPRRSPPSDVPTSPTPPASRTLTDRETEERRCPACVRSPDRRPRTRSSTACTTSSSVQGVDPLAERDGHRDGQRGRLVDGLRPRARRDGARGAGLRAVPQSRPRGRRRSCASWHRPGSVGRREPPSSTRSTARRSAACGMDDDKIAAIPSWPMSDLFSELERAVLAYADAMVHDHGRVERRPLRGAEARSCRTSRSSSSRTSSRCTSSTRSIVRALRLEWDDVPEPVARGRAAGRFRRRSTTCRWVPTAATRNGSATPAEHLTVFA